MAKKLSPLLIKLLSNGVTQREIAKKSRMAESKISEIISGRIVPKRNEKQRIARALGCEEFEIFGFNQYDQ